MKRLQVKSWWVFSTYFAEGFPYAIIASIPAIMFRDMSVDLSVIGFTSLLSLPWVLKFLWAPFVDAYFTLRKWLIAMELFLTILFVGLSLSLFHSSIAPLILLLGIGSFFAATHDISIDGFYMDALDESSQKSVIGFRVLSYRIALAVGTGVIVTIGTTLSWKIAYGTAAFIMFLLFLFHLFFLPQSVEHGREKRAGVESLKKAFISYFKQDDIVTVLLFVVFLRAGEYMLGLMKGPFFVDLGIKVHIGWISAMVAIPFSIVGAILGGAIIAKWGIKRTGIPIILFQNFTNLLYAALAFFSIDNIIVATAVVTAVESFSSGMGTALLMIVLIRLCDKEFKAAHYAIGSGFMALSGTLLNSFGGVLAESTGYGWFFVVSFVVALPAIPAFYRRFRI
ncbi:MFS transporter [bacterium]|nr:MFS transporter [bacterium]